MHIWRNSNKPKEDKNEIGPLENRAKQMRGHSKTDNSDCVDVWAALDLGELWVCILETYLPGFAALNDTGMS